MREGEIYTLPPPSIRVNLIFNPMKGSKFIRLITFDPGLVLLKMATIR